MPDDGNVKAFQSVDGGRKFHSYPIGDDVPESLPLSGGGIIHPYGITLIYGWGGVGKGWVCCYCIRELVREKQRPLILDFEGTEWEWRERLHGMGIRDRDGVEYAYMEGSLTRLLALDIAEAIQEDGFTHVIVDAVTGAKMATKSGDAGGEDSAISMFRNLRLLRVPVLAIAHEGKSSDKTPMGSSQLVHQSRLVYHAKAVNAYTTEVIMTKANDRPLKDKPLTFTRVIGRGGVVDIVLDYQTMGVVQVKPETIMGAILRILSERNRSMDADQMQLALIADGFEGADLVKIGTQMRRLHQAGKIERVSRGRYAAILA